MAALRGNRDDLLNSIIETLKAIKQLHNDDKNSGIDGLIKFLIRERDQFKKQKKSTNS